MPVYTLETLQEVSFQKDIPQVISVHYPHGSLSCRKTSYMG